MVEKLVEIIGDKWSLLIIGQLVYGKSPGRFNELMKELKPISSRTLSIKLAKLIDCGIVNKEIKNASPPFTNYTLTEKGLGLVSAFNAMANWSLKWLSPSNLANFTKSKSNELTNKS
jgi:DNA-binding HxlR family transcriptional regulator